MDVLNIRTFLKKVPFPSAVKVAVMNCKAFCMTVHIPKGGMLDRLTIHIFKMTKQFLAWKGILSKSAMLFKLS